MGFPHTPNTGQAAKTVPISPWFVPNHSKISTECLKNRDGHLKGKFSQAAKTAPISPWFVPNHSKISTKCQNSRGVHLKNQCDYLPG